MMGQDPGWVPRVDPRPRRLRSSVSISCVPSGQAEPGTEAWSSPPDTVLPDIQDLDQAPTPRNSPSTVSWAPHAPPPTETSTPPLDSTLSTQPSNGQ